MYIDRAGFQKDGTPDNEIGNGWETCHDLGLQNENLILKAAELRLPPWIMGLRNADKIREMLSIFPEAETIVAVIAVGKADEEPSRPKRRELEDVLKIF